MKDLTSSQRLNYGTNTTANVTGDKSRLIMTAEIVITAGTLSGNKADRAGEMELSGRITFLL